MKWVQRERKERDEVSNKSLSFASGRKSSPNWLKHKGKLLAQVITNLRHVFGFRYVFRRQTILSGLIFFTFSVSACPLMMASGSYTFRSKGSGSCLSPSYPTIVLTSFLNCSGQGDLEDAWHGTRCVSRPWRHRNSGCEKGDSPEDTRAATRAWGSDAEETDG